MADLLKGADDEDGRTEMLREAGRMQEKYWNMGFKRGIFEARQEHVQAGFDVAFETLALQSFCTAFLDELPEHSRLPVTDYTDIVVESTPQELEDLYRHIETLVKDKMCI
ncbi:hypothetical protein PSACC_02657 [Paramicrosporidium saccamoebae]|uniref:Uncharacterized protein n=1 Tax=Paramicrosporidium saccamoebae TaxID=1246581 RepID=A0A2H9TIG5_9FUNG|nr:hypothetical protein PSACC_02657 [Paramicrosporidium saccamoebae]